MNPPSKYQRHINQQRKFFGGSWDKLEDTKEWSGEYFSEKQEDGTWSSGYKNSDAYDELSDHTHRFVWAQYNTGSYDGDAWACWVDWEGECWVASCSHCCCNGLDYWNPVDSNEEYLRRMLNPARERNYAKGPASKEAYEAFEQVMKEVKSEKDVLPSTAK